MGRSGHQVFVLCRGHTHADCKLLNVLMCRCLSSLYLVFQGKMDAINVEKATEFVLSCCNSDGGFGSKPNAESHAGLIYCCVGYLSITSEFPEPNYLAYVITQNVSENLHLLDCDRLGWWLCERQLPSGGLNGRPEKLPDVCYSWWVLASLTIMGRLHWISAEKLEQFILSCQVG